MLKSLLLLALVTVVDPVPGPSGVDTLTPPTGAMYRSLAPFDLRQARVLDEETVTLELEMASYANPLGLPLGFSHPIIEVYIGGGEFGNEALLSGSLMNLPEGETWTVALRLTGDRAWGFEVTATGIREFEPVVTIEGGLLYVDTDVPALASPRLAAMVGLYSAFHETGWRPLEQTEGPWAFSSTTQQVPVVDVLALDMEAQRAALAGGILPVTEVNIIPNPNTLWLALMAGGLVVAAGGLALRSVAGRRAVAAQAEIAAAAEAERLAEAETEGAGEPEVRPVSAALARAMAATQAAALAVDEVKAADGDEAQPAVEEAEVEADATTEFDADAALTVASEDVEDIEPPRVGFFRGASPAELATARERLAAAAAEVDDAEADNAEPASVSEAAEPVSAGPQPEEPVTEPAEDDEDGLQSALDELAAVLGDPSGEEDAVAGETGTEEQSGAARESDGE